MAFFDDLGKKITKAGQTVAQKTKDVTGIAKLNVSISEEEKKINKIYLDIGKMYVEKHAGDCEEGLSELIAVIRESEAKITEYREQIKEIKGVIRCDKCGAEVEKNALFCNSCGNQLPKVEKVEENNDTQKCANCGNALAEGARFCTACGTPVAAPEAIQEEATPAVEVKKCAVCGAEIAEGNAFCVACGAKVE